MGGKKVITARSLTMPPPPCGTLVKILRRTAIAEMKSREKIIIDGVAVAVYTDKQLIFPSPLLGMVGMTAIENFPI